MNFLRFGGLAVLVVVSGCASTGSSCDLSCNPFCALGKDIKALGPAITDTSGLQRDFAAVGPYLADLGPNFQEELLRDRDVLFGSLCDDCDDQPTPADARTGQP